MPRAKKEIILFKNEVIDTPKKEENKKDTDNYNLKTVKNKDTKTNKKSNLTKNTIEETNKNNKDDNKDKDSGDSDREYLKYVKEPLEKIIDMLDTQINHLGVDDINKCLHLINNIKMNIDASILALIKFDKQFTERFHKLEQRKHTVLELTRIYIEQNRLNIMGKLKELEDIKKLGIKATNSDIDSDSNQDESEENTSDSIHSTEEEEPDSEELELIRKIEEGLNQSKNKKPEVKPEVKPEEKPEPKPKPEVKPEPKTRGKKAEPKNKSKNAQQEKVKPPAKPNPLDPNPIVKQEPKYIQYPNILNLNAILTNVHQQEIINRITSDAEYAKVYLQNFIPNNDPKKKTLKGTINILGNFNKQKGSREAYEVKVFENDPKGTFWCSCADHKFNSRKKNTICKHICFIVCKVLKVLQPYFFETKVLIPLHLTTLLGKFTDNSDFWKDVKLVVKSNDITIDNFKIFPEHIHDTCTFCYDDMTNADKPKAVSCPLCKHCFHDECMDVWLESQSKCSFCSNDYWKYYKRIKKGETVIRIK